MDIKIQQFSSLKKIYSLSDIMGESLTKATVLQGEHYSYQVAIHHEGGTIDNRSLLQISVDSPLKDYVKVYSVKNIPAEFPHPEVKDINYDFHTPTLVPDLLVPMESQKWHANLVNAWAVFWVEVCVDDNISGEFPVKIKIKGTQLETADHIATVKYEKEAVMNLNVIPKKLPEKQTKFTQWFHVDCIADVHGEEIYTDRHWELIDKYMKMASELGINMILTPVITPPLDTLPGTMRPCTQLVRVEKKGGEYIFDFSLLKKYISIAKRNGIKCFEISHFFSQWGCRFSPNIEVWENGEKKLMFGWHVPASDPSYKEFLSALVPNLLEVLEEEGVIDNCYFHISDEPSEEHIPHYEYASNLLKPLLRDCKIMDALSHVEFYEKGLVDHPVCCNDQIEPFIEKNVKGLWAYYCCAQREEVSNRFMSMPSYRNRITGLQLYKYGIEGFLHWGYNFYYSQYSLYEINPFITTSTDGIFSSGDAFSVYPGKNGPMPSIRAFVFREALEDIEICRLLEKKIGKKEVVELIEKEAGGELTFKNYPRNPEFIISVINKMKQML
ncbi:MAG: DUF4091 domain-containing protein [Clostridia bacterium]|nr:DUF4091 domain-containing protein [Clostridia bacterium]